MALLIRIRSNNWEWNVKRSHKTHTNIVPIVIYWLNWIDIARIQTHTGVYVEMNVLYPQNESINVMYTIVKQTTE